MRLRISTVFTCILLTINFIANSQPYATIDLDKDKPKQYENRKLQSEKTGDKKFTAPKRFFQNMFTHYNYYYNANNKYNEVLAKAKASYKEDYLQLLSFYNYSLDATAKNRRDIDSIISKCTAAILLHDLRNDWIDNMYMLLGKSYVLTKQFDSAHQVFQYINYAWAPKDDGYDIPIGSNASNTDRIFTVATNEKRSFAKSLISTHPSRNESFIWLARAYLEDDKVNDAVGLLSILRIDPNFPQRLQPDLHEMYAYAFYKQQVYDSAAWHLSRALDNAVTRSEYARWEYLIGQLYQLAGKNNEAVTYFNRAIQHTPDQLMEIYARMTIVGLETSNKENALQARLNELYKLAKKDRYESFRDLIYYAAAVLELRQKNTEMAKNDLKKSIQYSTDPQQKQKSFLLLADTEYDLNAFPPSHADYDSTITTFLKPVDKDRVDVRKPALKIISANLFVISREDSLQHLALMTEQERTAAAKKLLQKMRKAEGLKEDNAADYGNASNTSSTTTGSLFNNASSSAANDFYFSNASLRQRGYSDFKGRWGNRPNVDFWQRQSAIAKTFTATITNEENTDSANAKGGVKKPKAVKDLTVADMLKDIPLTEAQQEVSNTSIMRALLENGTTFQNHLQNYPAAIASYEELLRRFPNYNSKDQVLFNLVFCYDQMGQRVRSDSAASVLKNNYSKSKYTALLLNGPANDKKADAATQTYQGIYDMFIEGKFETAKDAKQKADAVYGKSYWTPQLLYIESIYYVTQRDDSTAINRLTALIKNFPTSPMKEKAETMISVLRRRSEIENYLTNLKLSNQEYDPNRGVDLNSLNLAVHNKKPMVLDTMVNTQLVYKRLLSPAKSANIGITDKTKPGSDSLVNAQLIAKGLIIPAKPEIKQPEKQIDSTVVNKPVIVANKTFAFNSNDPQYVVIMLNKVDEVFAKEAANAFTRYNRANNFNKQIDITSVAVNDDYKFILLQGFSNAAEAIDYINQVKPIAPTRIVPWLQTNKYSFTIISALNLDLLRDNKDVAGYDEFIKKILPGKW